MIIKIRELLYKDNVLPVMFNSARLKNLSIDLKEIANSIYHVGITIYTY